MQAFQYHKAPSLTAAAQALSKDPEAKPLSGGMTLLPTLKARLAAPTQLIDITGISELSGIFHQGATLSIGAATRHYQVASSDIVREAIPALADLAGQIGDPQVRNRGTLGGSVANNDPAADYPSAVLGLGATIVTNLRQIAASDFFLGMFATALEAGELIVRIDFPIPSKAAYAKFPHPASGYAMAGVFIAKTTAGIQVAVTGAGPGVFRWAEAEHALSQSFNPGVAATAALATDDLNADIHGTSEYRGQLVRVMAKRAIAQMST